MEQVNIGALLTKYNAGQANAEEVKLIEKCIEEGVIDLADLHDLNLLNEQVRRVPRCAAEQDTHSHNRLQEPAPMSQSKTTHCLATKNNNRASHELSATVTGLPGTAGRNAPGLTP